MYTFLNFSISTYDVYLGRDCKIMRVVYFDQLLGAARTQKLV